MNRFVHRVGGLLAALLMLYLAGTGTMMQLLDLKAIATHAPPTDPTVESFNEGKWGNDDFPVIQNSDFSAQALPQDFNYNRAIGTVLRAVHKPLTGTAANADPRAGESAPAPLAWVELRVANGIPIGQVMQGDRLTAFNAETGEAVAAVPSTGLVIQPSLRQRLKTLHRFWRGRDVPGVYFELLSGVILWTLLITGMVMYFRLLKTRTRQGRSQPFWLSPGGLWRGLHRVISVLAAVFILSSAFSGTWLGFESVVRALRTNRMQGPPPGQSQRPGQGQGPSQQALRRAVQVPVDFIVPLREDEVRNMTTVTLAAMRRLHPQMPIKALRLRIYGRMKQGVVIAGGDETTQLVFDATNGQPASLSDSSYPDSLFPFGTQVHENIKHFHSGALFGVPARLMNLFAGFSLSFLSISGLVIYFDMWRKRRKGGRNAVIWR